MNITKNENKQYQDRLEMRKLSADLKMTRKEFEEIIDPYMHVNTGSIFSCEELDEGEESSEAFIAVMMDETGDIVEWEA